MNEPLTDNRPSMRAKFQISHVIQSRLISGKPEEPTNPEHGILGLQTLYELPESMDPCDTLLLFPVTKHEPYDSTGMDEDNTFAKFTPSGELRMTISNPALVGVYQPGDTFYLDFTFVPPAHESGETTP